MISAWTSRNRSMSFWGSKVKPSRSASLPNASRIPFSQSIRVP